ncbi:hypothetical protein B0G76_1624 [Paraburkholderia sp. BL23I1N1]|uniref:DUF3024 domain-containing protein n=1 Tax=unclassified Paraburkholderia TaxID=2615204 RepID=UPI000E26578A|nr:MULTISPECIES: hypothetical protein [unclassified Paraburkholderia]REE18513.1 hypothetical protein B0G71_1553 [Paraburkholderia sp. BL27I4N3]RKE35527.1 hypothetical protein B0G76_1624 [Paraburkholderia sp. BL23I1N1]
MTVQASAPEAAAPRDGLRASRPFDLTQRQIEQALRERTRYHYVLPRVLRDGQGFRVESPCCSRNVDANGGLIDIAWLTRDEDGMWHLSARDHASHRWMPQHESTGLAELLDTLCIDRECVFWP